MSRARACACLRAVAPIAAGQRPLQAKLRIGAANDPLEREADTAADAVLRGERVGSLGHSSAVAQRECSGCAGEPEEEHEVQRKCADGDSARSHGEGAGETAAEAVAAGGAPLSRDLRNYFEPRFGRDFSDVRVHTGARADGAAGAIGARAYTLGKDVAFASGEYAPSRREGRRLIAHELAHVVQQDGTDGSTVRRSVAAFSTCPPNVHGASADPLADITAADEAAQLMALGSANVLNLEALLFADPTFGRSYVSDAYERRFGLPSAAGRGRFFNRLTGGTHPSRDAAMGSEMETLAVRFELTHSFLSQNIGYRCPGTGATTIPGCRAGTCGAETRAFSCPGGGIIALCRRFWDAPEMNGPNPRGATLIHEAIHAWLGVRLHRAEGAPRVSTPECYAAFVADIFGFTHNDQDDCTATIP